MKLISKPTNEVAAAIAALNELCFGDEDFYNKADRVAGCVMYAYWTPRNPDKLLEDDELIAYALVKPGRVSTLERYGVRYGGMGHGQEILKLALSNHRIVTTYAAGSNGASCAALIKAGFFISGTDNGFITFMYLRPDEATSS